jgi:hypothetical protein
VIIPSIYLDIEKDRVARLESGLGALVHAEAFVASYKLSPIMHDFVTVPFSIKKLVASGLFKGKRSISQLSHLNEFSEKELCVLGGLCGEMPPIETPTLTAAPGNAQGAAAAATAAQALAAEEAPDTTHEYPDDDTSGTEKSHPLQEGGRLDDPPASPVQMKYVKLIEGQASPGALTIIRVGETCVGEALFFDASIILPSPFNHVNH